jgi:hypothetical protein
VGARGRRLAVDDGVLADAWYLAHALIGAESIGAVLTCMDVGVADRVAERTMAAA